MARDDKMKPEYDFSAGVRGKHSEQFKADVVRHDAKIDLAKVPTISAFYGILIRMFFNDHSPPHFHARYGEFEVIVDIDTLDVIAGELPPRALNLVREWAMMHKEELLEDWRLCREKAPPAKIEPLL